MSFRLGDLKKTVRKGKDGHGVSPVRLEGRQFQFQIEFLLRQFEEHVGRPRKLLEPDMLLDFIGDARIGRGLLATLSQWYRMRPRTFAEELEGRPSYDRLLARGISGPPDLRAWLYASVNAEADGYLDPERDELFWQSQRRTFGLRREGLEVLASLDRPEEAVLVRVGPAPTSLDVMAAYNARACTTLLRSAREVTLVCGGAGPWVEESARRWCEPLGVEWKREGSALALMGRADILGCWTRHGRKVERAALELVGQPELDVRELRGRVEAGDKSCTFQWKSDTLDGLDTGTSSWGVGPELVDEFASVLRRERERSGGTVPGWEVRRPACLLAVRGGSFLPHLELRRGDRSLSVRLASPDTLEAEDLGTFAGKSHVAVFGWESEAAEARLLLPGEDAVDCRMGEVLPLLAEHLERSTDHAPAAKSGRVALKRAA